VVVVDDAHAGCDDTWWSSRQVKRGQLDLSGVRHLVLDEVCWTHAYRAAAFHQGELYTHDDNEEDRFVLESGRVLRPALS
jgi:hypothetical protein